MEREVRDIPEFYSEMMQVMRNYAIEESSRNGPVLTLQEPITVTVLNPLMRANVDPIRRCNPFFHIMEFVWMMAGTRSPEWISQFNKRFVDYADTNNHHGIPLIHGAYGYRWLMHFGVQQIPKVVEMLRKDPTTRRAVIAMWHPTADLGTAHNDLPCNTHIYLRIMEGALDFTVCNRSNDVIWGMTGANAVHMTMLQEMIANALNIYVGNYRVFTINAHVYLNLPDIDKMIDTRDPVRVDYSNWDHISILQPGESIERFMEDCRNFVRGSGPVKCGWMNDVAVPVYEMWFNRDQQDTIFDTEWNQACNLWLRR